MSVQQLADVNAKLEEQRQLTTQWREDEIERGMQALVAGWRVGVRSIDVSGILYAQMIAELLERTLQLIQGEQSKRRVM